MSQQRVERRLAAILAADVAGYSRLMGADEAGTARRLREHREAVTPIITEHGGRIVKTTGDGVLLEFPSVVAAVECAVAMQTLMAERNAGLGEDERMLFRIGINLGDVLIEGDDILGDGVNIAARLEGIAQPGGICISGSAFDHVRGKVDATFIDMGEQSLKNIVAPIRVFGVAPPIGIHSATSPTAPLTPRLSIVVLPFANLSRDAEQDYFVDGLTEDLTTELSRLPGSFVIARNSAFSYKGKSPDVRQVGRELGVRYVLEGSVRKAGRRVRVAAQLIDAETGAHLWADRFDREISDLFELQDAITVEIARALDLRLVEAESRRSERAANPDALDLVFRARAFFNRSFSRENRAAATRLYTQALQLAPDDVQTMRGLSVALAANVAEQWSETPEEDLCRAEALAARAVALDPQDAWCHFAIGFVRRLQHRFADAINDLEAAIQIDPNMHLAHAQLAWLKVLSGRGEDALPQFSKAIHLSPRDPRMFFGYFGIGWVRFLLGDDDGAIEMVRKAIALNPNYSPAYLCLTAAHGMQGRMEAARAALAAYLQTGTPTSTIALVRARPLSTHPNYLVQRERIYEGLRKAGMPEE